MSSCADPSFDPGYAQIWNLQTGKPSGPQFNHRDGVAYVTFSPDGKYLATAGEDFVAVIWEVATARQLTVLKHPEKIMTVAFSPDGKLIVTTCVNGTARIWNVRSGDPLTPPLRHESVLRDARFLSDGHGIVTTGTQEDHYVWNLTTESMPLNDLKKLAGVLSGDTMLPPADSPKVAWPELKSKYPASFTVSSAEIDAWHEFQAEEAELDGKWTAVAFHLQNRLAENSGNAAIIQRITVAEKHIKNGD